MTLFDLGALFPSWREGARETQTFPIAVWRSARKRSDRRVPAIGGSGEGRKRRVTFVDASLGAAARFGCRVFDLDLAFLLLRSIPGSTSSLGRFTRRSGCTLR